MTSDKGKSEGNRNNGTSKRSFASMDEEKQREIASKGGKASMVAGAVEAR